MANYYGQGRTNYFAVKDLDAFKEEVSKYAVEVVSQPDDNSELTLVALLDTDPDGGGFPWEYCDEDEYQDIEWGDVFRRHLADGWVAILMEIGSEKYRYLNGTATAWNNKGQSVHLNLSDIVTLAMNNNLGDNITAVSY